MDLENSPEANSKLNMTILYAEDEEVIRGSLSRIMSRKVQSVITASDGRDALEKFNQSKPDIVITDINMPNMGGLELAGNIKKISPETPIVIITAFTDTEHFIRAIEIGVDKFMLKPTDSGVLFSIIQEYYSILEDRRELERLRFAQLKEDINKATDIKLESMLGAIPLPTVILDDEDTIIAHNKRFESLFDIYADKEILEELKKDKLNIWKISKLENMNEETGIVGWKEMAIEIDDESQLIVELYSSSESQRYSVALQISKTICNTPRYIACFSKMK